MATLNHVSRVPKPLLPIAASIAAARPAAGALAGLRILVVHESAEITAVLAEVFTAAGARVAVAHEGSEANVLLAWGGHHVVFLDAAVAGATGVLELIADHRPSLLSRTIVLTADLRDGEAKARLRESYPAASFRDSWFDDLVDLAVRTTAAAPERRAVA